MSIEKHIENHNEEEDDQVMELTVKEMKKVKICEKNNKRGSNYKQ